MAPMSCGERTESGEVGAGTTVKGDGEITLGVKREA